MTGWLLWCTFSAARGGDAEAEVLALTRALAYDRRLADRAGDDVRIAIHSDPRDPASVERAKQVRAVLDGMAPFTVQSLPVVIDDDSGGVDVIYVCTAHLPDALVTPSRRSRPVLVGFGRGIVEEGVHLGITEQRDGLRLLVNLKTSRQAGVDFSSRLLQVAQVFR